ncbi:glycosyltransferase [Paenibacillus lemnae]|uniref:glycosyltransferase n=1 Tax=Paenibacillus lemnae TaxID=1330551 RepID=UPI0031B5F909
MFFQILLMVIAVQLLFVLWNGHTWIKPPKKSADRKDLPLLSVLIPARNEENNIEGAIQSVLDNSYSNLEVVILDDRSDDATSQIVLQMAERDSRVRLIQGEDMPEGWCGKVYACHQLSLEAKGEWWLFMDADVRLKTEALSSVCRLANQQTRGMITGFPFQIVNSWMERLIVPLMTFTILCHLPISLVRKASSSKFAAAHGGFIFVYRDSYRKAGGHAAIPDQLVDDMALARAFKQAKEPVLLADVHQHVQMRMYHSAAEVWGGYRKNIFDGLGRSISLLLAVSLFYFVLYVFPAAFMMYSLITMFLFPESHQEWGLLLWTSACVLAGISVKMAADLRQGQPGWLAFLQPISMLLLILLALDSCRTAFTRKGYQWKGRFYS